MEREKFEAWARDHGWHVERASVYDRSDYKDKYVDCLWLGWEARAPKRLTPEQVNHIWMNHGMSRLEYTDAIQDALGIPQEQPCD